MHNYSFFYTNLVFQSTHVMHVVINQLRVLSTRPGERATPHLIAEQILLFN